MYKKSITRNVNVLTRGRRTKYPYLIQYAIQQNNKVHSEHETIIKTSIIALYYVLQLYYVVFYVIVSGSMVKYNIMAKKYGTLRHVK